MAATLQPVGNGPPTAAAAGRRALLRYCPALTLLLFLAPLAAGLIGTWLPAFGYFPTLGADDWSLDPWRRLLADPALPAALRLTLTSGLLATLLSLVLALGFVAACHGTRLFLQLQHLLAPLLALPHVALAIGFAFLVAPSGWIARLLSPWATGWTTPPDIATVQDTSGLALTAALVIKETPFLLLMILAALGQTRAAERIAIARSLGYGPFVGWLKTVLPAIYPQIRLPVYAVLAYSLSVVDMALILAPTTPPPLAVVVFRWFGDPDLSLRFVAAAGAVLQLLIVAGGIGLCRVLELICGALARSWIASGRRGGSGRLPRAALGGTMLLLFGLSAMSLLALLIWSMASRWRYPDALPQGWSLDSWSNHGSGLLWAGGTTVIVGVAAALIAVVLVLGCLENEQRHGLHPSSRGLWLLYLPLLVPQVGFLFGVQVLAVELRLDGTWLALVWCHLLFVLPYVFLALADPYRALDERYARAALCLGASPARVFWRVKLPMLLRPVLTAVAVGFAVSVAQYLPTLFAGAGRFVTLTTEAVSLASGADRRVIGVFALVQAVLPLGAFAIALSWPSWRSRLSARARVAER